MGISVAKQIILKVKRSGNGDENNGLGLKTDLFK